MSTLFELNAAFEEAIELYNSGCEDVVDTETGEIIPIGQYLSQLEMEKEQKIDNCVLYIKSLDYEESALKEEIKRLKERLDSKTKRKESLKEYVSAVLNGQKRETAQYKLSYRNSQSVEVSDVSKIPKQFVKIKTEVAPDKVAIKAALKAGEAVDGAQLVDKVSMQIK